MNDKIMINTISKIYFIIVSFLSFIFLILCSVFILLQNGVYIDDISLPNLKVKKLYIKWDKKINITADEIKILQQNNKKSLKKIDIQKINSYFKKAILFNTWFEKIIINHIVFNDTDASFKYIDGKKGFLNISSPNFLLKSSLFFESKLLNIQLDNFYSYKQNINIKGNIILDIYNLELISSLKTSINNNAFLDIYLIANKNKLFYKIVSDKKIKSIIPIVDMFKLDKDIRYWLVDAMDVKDISLKYVYGWLDYKHIDQTYKHIYAKAILNKLNYTYDTKLDNISTTNTLVEFKNGILNIKPHNAYTYGFFLDKSWLKIDFNKKEEFLTLYLKFNATLNKDILNLLERYKIKLPLKQNSGNVDTDLTLGINLRTLDVEAHGDFFTKKGNFKYLGLNIDVFDTHVKLDNFNVKIKNMLAKYKQIATAKVDVDFDAKNGNGDIYFRFKDINFSDMGLYLDNKKELDVTYHISTNQDTIDIDNSQWKFKNYNIILDKQTIPLQLSTLSAKIPTTLLKVNDFLSAYISGTASINPNKFNLDVDLLKFKYKDIKLSKSNTKLKMSYLNKNLSIKSIDEIRLNLNNFNPVIKDMVANFKHKQFDLINANISFENLFQANLNGYYNNASKSGYINLKEIELKKENYKKFIQNKKNLNFLINVYDNKIALYSKKLDIRYISTNKEWKLHFGSIKKLAQYSKQLKQYHIDNGSLIIFKNINDDIKFKLKIKYPYKLLVKNNIPIENYIVTGKVQNKTNKISLKINDLVTLNIDKDIRLKANDIGVNLNALLDYFNNQDIKSDNTKLKNIFLDFNNSYLWIGKKRHVISDTINLQYFNNITTAQLKYKKGKAEFKFDNGNFYLYGEKFNDKFMENLFSLSKFKGGELSFSMNGTTDEYDGVFYVANTTILDYKILNNILAFVNTIPSLVTFSLPGYNKNGLAVKSAYTNFHSKDNTIEIKNIYLDSKEMDIVGRGNLSFARDEIDLILNLKTDLGSSINKIPVVGYILLGDDTISTSLSIKGKLHDPAVNSLIAKDIIVAPLNIIKRTFMLPFNVFDKK